MCVPASEVCNRIDDDCDGLVDEDLGFASLGAPKEVWADAGSQVSGADLVAVEGGLLIGLQHVPGSPHNQTTIRTDANGDPIGTRVELDTRPSYWGPRLSIGPNGTVSMSSCGIDEHETFAYSALVDGSNGTLIGQDIRQSPTDYSCGADTPDGLFAGKHFLYGWVENSTNADGDQVVFDVCDEKLKSLGSQILTREGDLAVPPRFARRGERLAVSYGLRGHAMDSLLRVHVFRDPLAPLPDPVELPAPSGQDWGDTEILPSARGFLLLSDNRFYEGLLRAAVDADGSIIEEATAIENAREKYSTVHATTRSGGGFVLAASSYDGKRSVTVMLLRDDGSPWSATSGLSDAQVLSARGLPDGRVAILYGQPTAKDESALTIEFFGCSM